MQRCTYLVMIVVGVAHIFGPILRDLEGKASRALKAIRREFEDFYQP
jgi:hypothetical protein